MGGIRLESAVLEERGFQHDRRWMLVDESGIFLSQRTYPQMALLQVTIQADGLQVSHKQNEKLILHIPFAPETEKVIPVTIWEDTIEGQVVSDLISAWFSKVLGIPCSLVKMPESAQRRLKEKHAVNRESVSYADGMPYLIIGQESLNDLNARLEIPVPMDRFRPNLVFSGGSAFVEDEWKTVKIGVATFKVTKPCARCVMTTIDQCSAMKSKEPLKTLASYRTIDNNVMFGQNMLVLNGLFVKIGESVIGQK